MSDFLTIQQASRWASSHLNKNVTPSNISYLIQYGKILRISKENGTFVNKKELTEYYKNKNLSQEQFWQNKFGDDINWTLSFSEHKEADTTKHVHRLHPYKGKFIPQLVEYFLDDHIDNFKKESFFSPEDIVLDPFCGSGTTLVQANELNLHGIGIDVSPFNALISNVKIDRHNIPEILQVCQHIEKALNTFQQEKNNVTFERELLHALKIFNEQHFPSPEFKRNLQEKKINEPEYAKIKVEEFTPIYQNLIEKYKIRLIENKNANFLEAWFFKTVLDEIYLVFEEIKKIPNQEIKKAVAIILSRTIRSCRATTHSDLGTLKHPVIKTYYCKKHAKICKPTFSISSWWNRYYRDTINRFISFDQLRTNTHQFCITGDSRNVDIKKALINRNKKLGQLLETQKIRGIFSSPPYVGLINYHEQHAYAYDLLNFERNDELEIGPLFNGQGKAARDSYVDGVSAVLNNCKKYLQNNYDVFLVANDKHGLYPQIAARTNMKIINQFQRPVLNRVEKNRATYSETIFHLKEK